MLYMIDNGGGGCRPDSAKFGIISDMAMNECPDATGGVA